MRAVLFTVLIAVTVSGISTALFTIVANLFAPVSVALGGK